MNTFIYAVGWGTELFATLAHAVAAGWF